MSIKTKKQSFINYQTNLKFGVQIYSNIFQSHHSNGFIRLSGNNRIATITVCYCYLIAILVIGNTVSFFTSVRKIIHMNTHKCAITTQVVMFHRIIVVNNRNKGKTFK